MTHHIEHSIKERQYICLLLNRLFIHVNYGKKINTVETAMEWLAALRQVDGIMLSVRGGTDEPFCVNTENNMMCFEGKYL
jgi:hypothetical protein